MDEKQVLEELGKFKHKYPQMDVPMVRFFAETMMIFHQVPIMMEAYFYNLNLSKGRFHVLIQLLADPRPEGISIGEIACFYKVSSATLTGIIDTLEREGLIERLPSREDRRKVNVRMTARGMAFMEEVLPKHHANIREITAGIGDAERAETLMVLRRLRDDLQRFLENTSRGNKA